MTNCRSQIIASLELSIHLTRWGFSDNVFLPECFIRTFWFKYQRKKYVNFCLVINLVIHVIKPKVFWCFQGYRSGTLVENGLINNSNEIPTDSPLSTHISLFCATVINDNIVKIKNWLNPNKTDLDMLCICRIKVSGHGMHPPLQLRGLRGKGG